MAFYLYACGLSSGVPGYIVAKSLELGQKKKKRYLLIKGFLLCFFTDTVTAFAMKRQYYSGQLLHISALPCCDRTHRYSLLANSLACTGTVEAAMAMQLQTLYLPHPSWLRTPCLLLRCVDLTRLSRQNKPGTLWPNSNEEVCQILLFLKTQAEITAFNYSIWRSDFSCVDSKLQT